MFPIYIQSTLESQRTQLSLYPRFFSVFREVSGRGRKRERAREDERGWGERTLQGIRGMNGGDEINWREG